MSIVLKRVVTGTSFVIMAILAVATLLAMVIAPYCTGIMHKADIYKIASLCVFLPAYYLLAWRRESLMAALLIPVAQIASGWAFASYLNSLPMSCSP